MSAGMGDERVLYVGNLDDGTNLPTLIETLGDLAVKTVWTASAAREAMASNGPACFVTKTTLEDGEYRDLVAMATARDPAVPVVVIGSASSIDRDLFSNASVRFVYEGDATATARTALAQIRNLVSRESSDRRLLSTIPAPAFVYDERFVDWNDQFLEVIGEDSTWLSDRPLSDVLECTPVELTEAAAEGTSLDVVVASSNEATTYTLSVARDGSQYVGLLEAPTPTAAASTTEPADPTILSSLMEDAPLAIYAKDRPGRHVAVSRYQVGMGEQSSIDSPDGKRHHAPEDVLGKTDFDLYPNRDAERFREVDERVMEDEQSHVEREQVGLTTEGQDFAVTDMKVPWYDEDGDVQGVVGVTIPVTESWRAKRRAAIRDAALNTVETIFRSQIRPEFVENGETNEKEIDLATERAMQDIETLLLTRKLPEGTEAAELQSHAERVWMDIGLDNASLEVPTTGVVDAHPDLLDALFEELFDNVAVHCRPDTNVRVGQLEDGFYVEDDGPGIAPARRDDIFRYGTTTSDNRVGGGLAIVDAIARSHDWTASITEGIDGGTRLIFTGIDFH